jgi:uncharacterized RDD family membrane protein YckC
MAERRRLTVATPEGAVFSLDLAGPATRFLAWLVDVMIVAVAVRSTAAGLTALGVVAPGLAIGLYFLADFLISMGYAVFMEWRFRGQTLGKRLFHLRVMDERALNLTFSQVVVRNLLRAVDALPGLYLVGGAAVLISGRAQRLGDLAANTVVIRESRPAPLDLTRIAPAKYNSLLSYPHLVARLRQAVDGREADLILQALLRRERLEPAARLTLYADLADHFRGKVDFPQEAVDGLSDEQYLRNVAEALFRGGA